MHAHPLPASGDLPLLFLASLLGSAHCAGMCGPYVALCSSRVAAGRTAWQSALLQRLLFNGGRLATYTAIGAAAGAFGRVALATADLAGARGTIAILAGGCALAFGAALLGWVRDPAHLLLGLGLDELIREGARGAFRQPPYVSTLALGALQGALPCALVYGAAARAALAASAPGGAATMLVFGLGTLPAIVAVSLVSPRLLARLRVWRWSGALVGAVGVLLVLRGLADLGAVSPSALW